VIAAGRRSTPVARWIRRQSRGRTRLVHLGRPWAPLACFDLVVTTPQYGLPARRNVLHNLLPLTRVDPARLAAARARWAPRLAALRRPLVALLAGGDSPPYVLDPPTAARIGREATETARGLGGTLVLTCGPRVRPESAEALIAAAAGAGHAHRFRPDDPDNPYLGYLALADRFIVTGDSASMLAEAWTTGKPVTIVALPEQPRWKWRTMRRLQNTAEGWGGVAAWAWGQVMALGVTKRTRDLTRLHRALQAHPPGAPREDDLGRAVARVRQLVGERVT
jgi:mitochondrial fission protein ELM1